MKPLTRKGQIWRENRKRRGRIRYLRIDGDPIRLFGRMQVKVWTVLLEEDGSWTDAPQAARPDNQYVDEDRFRGGSNGFSLQQDVEEVA